MNDKKIKCPNCGTNIELSEAVTQQVEDSIEERLRTEYNQRFKDTLKDRETKLRKQVIDEMNLRLQDVQDELKLKNERLKEAQEKEMILLKRQRELSEREQNFRLELERQLTEKVQKIREDAITKLNDQYRLRDAEKDKKIHDMLRQIEELKVKAEQGSQQSQGEILELELEHLLKQAFRYDEIMPVAKGVKGADVIQNVRTSIGNFCGTIIWESKRTKAWSDGWIQKLKDDQREAKADIAVIVTASLPKEVVHFGYVDGIWVCDFATAMGMATVLRFAIIEQAQIRNTMIGKNEKMELVYSYLSGQEFRQRITAIVEAFKNMKDDLDAEKTAMERIWKKREKQIERVLLNTTRMYGELEGIFGSALPPIMTMELPFQDNEPKDE